jgi:outer membrane receptor protein involved in Fe transport
MIPVLRRPCRRSLLAHALPAFAAVACFASTAVLPAAEAASDAKPAPAVDADVVAMQNFVVTGSNIKRLDMEKIAPVTVLTQDSIEARNALTPVDLLTSLPQVISLPENETRTGSSGARGDNANINFRNLGATATLILVDGRRMAINPMTAGLSQAVNVNQLPTQGVDHIEVLRDGASSVYGSDAVGGVVNYVMSRDFRGTEVSLRYGVPEHAGGQFTEGTVKFGTHFAGGKGRFVVTAEAFYREAIYLRDRDFSKVSNTTAIAPAPFNVLGSAFDARSARGFFPTFLVGTSTTNNYLKLVNGVPTLTTAAPTRAANPEFYLDLNLFTMAQPRAKRTNSFASVEYDLTKQITFFGDLGYYRSVSTMVRQPLALNAPTTDAYAVMSADNPYNPFGSRFYDANGAPNADGTARLTGAPRTVSLVSETILDLPVEEIKTTNDAVRLTGGFRGKFGSDWTWEGAGFYNRVRGKDEGKNDVRESLLAAALQRTDATAFNPFGYTFKVVNGAVVVDQPYKNPKATVDSFNRLFVRNAESSIASGDAHASGKLFTLWAGDLRTALGTEFRHEDLKDLRPPFSGENPASSGLDPLNNDFILHPARPDVRGKRDVTSFYAEVVVPIVAPKNEIPLFRTLEFNVSARNENYSDFGNTTKPKYGVNWRPVDGVMLRGSYNEGFQAPSLAALYTSPRWSISAGAGDIDPYRNPVTNEGPYIARNYFGGSPTLKAAESVGKTGGIVVDVPYVKGLSFTVDYWQVRRTNLLGQRSTAQVYTSDVALIQAYTKSQLAAGKSIDQIDIGSGTANYKGDPDVTRLAPTAQDIALFADYNAKNPGNQQAVAGKIFANNTPFVNLASSYDKGVDLGMSYQLPKMMIGRFSLNSDWSYVAASKSTTAPSNVPAITTDNVNVGGEARWRGTTTLAWRNGNWGASFGAYYIGASADTGATTTAAVWDSLGRPGYIAKQFNAGAYTYRYVIHDVVSYNTSVSYRFPTTSMEWLRRSRVRLGVVNIADKAPPLTSGQSAYSPSIHQNLVQGRTWTVELTKAF